MEARFLWQRPGFTLDVDLQLPAKGVTALFGHSGSGKTSCLRCFAGLEHPDQGWLRIDGQTWQDSRERIFRPAHKRPMGYVFQEASLFEHLNVRRNLEYGWRRIATASRRIRLEQAVELLGIEHLLARMPDKLSGGERQRVGIARALLTSPRLLLMDEPLAALDGKRKAEILPYLERLHGELDIPVLYVSHAPDEVARLADHLVVLEQGKVVASGAIAPTLARLELESLFGEQAGVVVDTRVEQYDRDYRLATVQMPGSGLRLYLAGVERPLGSALRVKITARDVSLSLQAPQDSSILNRLPARVVEIREADNPAHVLVRLDASGVALMARITRYSHDQLQLHPGQALWAQVKSVALLS